MDYRSHKTALFVTILVVLLVIGFGILLAQQKRRSLISSPTESKGALWVEDNNLHEAGGVPVDALQMYDPTFIHQWSEARKQIRVYMYRYNSLKNPENGYTDAYLRDNLLPLLKESNIDFALDVPPPNWYCGTGDKLMEAEGDYIQKISDLGGEVNYISLQSVLSKPKEQCPNYTTDQRIDNVVRFTKYIKNRLPNMQVGIIDALVAKGEEYRSVYRQLVDSLDKENLILDYIHLDFPMEKANKNWQNLKEAEEFIREELDIRVGVTYTSSRGGMTSAKAWQRNILQAYEEYHAAGGKPDDLLIMSWYMYPRYNLPETEPYTLMNTVLKFSKL